MMCLLCWNFPLECEFAGRESSISLARQATSISGKQQLVVKVKVSYLQKPCPTGICKEKQTIQPTDHQSLTEQDQKQRDKNSLAS